MPGTLWLTPLHPLVLVDQAHACSLSVPGTENNIVLYKMNDVIRILSVSKSDVYSRIVSTN